MNTHKEEQAPIEWLLDDLLITILDSSPKELIGPHNKLEALAESIQERKSELAPLEPKEEEIPYCDDCDVDLGVENHTKDCPNKPTPPSQIEETLTSPFEQGYEMGVKHGRVLALKELEIEKLSKEIEELK